MALRQLLEKSLRDFSGHRPAERTYLISAGASPNSVNSAGETPLMHLRSDAPVGFVHKLIELGSDVKARDDSGRSVLTTLARSSTRL